MKTTVIHHSADYDGIFCREIARKFLPDAELIGWDFVDKPLAFPSSEVIYVMDLPIDRVFGFEFRGPDMLIKGTKVGTIGDYKHIVWIDHHKSSIDSHPASIPGYRIDGVAACRLAWQWFTRQGGNYPGGLPIKQDFVERKVEEPIAVRLAGEYDVWDHRGDGDLEFQFGLDATALTPAGWECLLSEMAGTYAQEIVHRGKAAMQCYAKRDADVMRTRSFRVNWEGLNFLALNTPRCNSNTYASLDIPETGHDALMAFFFNGKDWNFSLYHAAHRKDIDLSQIAVKYGGGGHRGACGFRVAKLPF